MRINYKFTKMLASTFFFLFFSCQYANSETEQWVHPLGLPYGDITYDEWAKWKGLPRLSDEADVLQQLEKHYNSDAWAGFIASEIIRNQNDGFLNDESERPLSASADQGNPVAQAQIESIQVSGAGEKPFENITKRSHPRAMLLKGLKEELGSTEQLRLFRYAAIQGDEMALFFLAMDARRKSSKDMWDQDSIQFLRQAVSTPGLFSANPISRDVRLGNDAPQAFFYLAQALLKSSDNPDKNEIEGLLLEATKRNTALDGRRYAMFGENTAARAHSFLATEIYDIKRADHVEKIEHHLSMSSSTGDPAGSYFLARRIYHPAKGIKPDKKKYIETLELASKQGGLSERLDLAKEYLTGRFVERDVDYALELVKEFDSEENVEVRIFIGEALLSGTSPQIDKGLGLLTGIWKSSKQPEAAELIAQYYASARHILESGSLSNTWFIDAFNAYMNQSRQERASILAAMAAGEALRRNDKETFLYWKSKVIATSEDQEDIDMVEVADALFTIGYGSEDEGRAKIPFLKEQSEKENLLANMILGMVSLSVDEEERKNLSLENYDVYFDKAIIGSGHVATGPIIQFLLVTLGQNDQEKLLDWLIKTERYHGPDESALLAYLKHTRSKENTSEYTSSRVSLINAVLNGSGFAAGYVADQRDTESDGFPELEIGDVELLISSVTSNFPYPDSYAVLGNRYSNGVGVDKDIKAAEFLYIKGAESGSGKAMIYIAEALSSGTLGYTDLETAIQYGELAVAYGQPSALELTKNLKQKMEQKEDEARQLREQLEKEHQLTKAGHNGYTYQAHTRPSGTSVFFKKLGGFLVDALTVGLVIGFVVLAASAGVDASPMIVSDPSYQQQIYYTAPRTTIQIPAPVNSIPPATAAGLRSAGMPSYLDGKTVYNTKPTSYLSVSTPTEFNAYGHTNSLPQSIMIKQKYNYDPASKYRGAVNPDGTFIAKSIDGTALTGKFRQSPSGKMEMEVRPRYDYDPAHKYRGELETGGNVRLRNPYTGHTIKGQYNSDSSYEVR